MGDKKELTNCDKCLRKITVRNFITVATISVFLALVIYTVIVVPDVLENPLITFLLGTFVSVVTMIYQFYYRKNKTKPEFDDRIGGYGNGSYKFDTDIDNICPCCGQKIKR
jgi:hypothetical protein